MANMSYCRFENTYHDLVDCVQTLERIISENESISEREWRYAKRMYDWCQGFVESFEEIDEEEININ